jgi:hypothetical protein
LHFAIHEEVPELGEGMDCKYKKRVFMLKKTKFKPENKLSQQVHPNYNIKIKKIKLQETKKVPTELQILDLYLFFCQINENSSVIKKENFVKLYAKFHIVKDQAEKIFDELVKNKKQKFLKFIDFLLLINGSLNENQKFQIRKKLEKIKTNLMYIY